MKLKLLYILCAVALLPAALLAWNVDAGVSWADSMPDTLQPGQPFLPRVRVTNHTQPPALGTLCTWWEDPTGARYYTNRQVVQVMGLSSIVVDFGPLGFTLEGWHTIACSLIVANDTNPANDTLRHRVYVPLLQTDIGLAWDPVPPDTVDSGSSWLLGVRATNQGGAQTSFNLRFTFMNADSTGLLSFTRIVTALPPCSSRVVQFGPVTFWEQGQWCNSFVYPGDTISWHPYVRCNGVEEERQSASVAPGLRPLPTHVAHSVTIHCHEPAPVLVYNTSGNLVRTLAPGREVVWDGRDRFGRDVPAGVYSICHGSGQSARVVKAR